MKAIHREVGHWLAVFCGLIAHEIRLAAAQVHEFSRAAPFDSNACEVLSGVVFVLQREQDDVLARIREFFGKPEPADLSPPLVATFTAAEAEWTRGVGVLGRSIASRIAVARKHRALADAHSRLLLELHACAHEGFTLPMLRRLRPSESLTPDLQSVYAAVLPVRARHPDDFLGLTVDLSVHE
jgi:hypothetical protein